MTYEGGNAGDMGEELSSKLGLIPVFGVGGVTLPMNQDCEYEKLIQVITRSNEKEHTGTHPRSPPTSFTAFVISFVSKIGYSKPPKTHVGPVIIPLEHP
jgi:hypothetical protein